MGNWNFYNEWEPYAADWIRNLIKKGLIPDGEVDQRSIADVSPDDLRGFTQCHFFAGVAGFSLALKLAGFPSDREIWTGSCPCQPFSCAGKGKGTADERHLWPHLFRLIRACRPPYAIGEQVGGSAGLNWLDGVFNDLEGENYSCQAFNLSACSVNSPHIRERLYWVGKNMGQSNSAGWYARQSATKTMGHRDTSFPGSSSGNALDDTKSEGWEGRIINTAKQSIEAGDSYAGPASSDSFDMADTNMQRAQISFAGKHSTIKEPGSAINTVSNMAHTKLQGEGWRGIQRSSESSEPMGTGAPEEPIGSSASISQNMADANDIGCDGSEGIAPKQGSNGTNDGISIRRDLPTYGAEDLADAESQRRGGWTNNEDGWWRQLASPHSRTGSSMADTQSEREPSRFIECTKHSGGGEFMVGAEPGSYGVNSRISSFWDDAIWLRGADGKTRRAPGITQPGFCGMADGLSDGMDGMRPTIPLLTTQTEARVHKLKALGNAIVPQLAAEFIKAIMET